MALRLAYGNNGYFLFSVGGFNASFNPGGLELPKVARAGVCTSVAIAWFKLENYFALTSNTFQIGASVEAGIELGPISAHGWIRFDALIQFEPFYFVAAIDAGFDVEVFGVSLCGVRVQGRLSGPGPLVVEARATVKVLFAKASESVTIKLGSGPHRCPGRSIFCRRCGEFGKSENTRADGQDTSVVLRNDRATIVNGATVVQAVGAVIWEQKPVPFSLDLQRFQGTPLSGKPPSGAVVSDAAAGEERDWFGMGTYLNLSDSEALNNGRFTRRSPASAFRWRGGRRQRCRLPCGTRPDQAAKALPDRDPGCRLHERRIGEDAAPAYRDSRHAAGKKTSLPSRGKKEWKVVAADGGGEGLSGAQAFLAQRGGAGLAQPSTAVAVGLVGVL